MISLYDTLTGEVRPLELRQPGRVSLYVCGPTVYDQPHLGHARSALSYDVLRRYLQWRGFEVHHVANVTDIDDKIIDRASREGLTEAEVATKWEAVYDTVMDALGILRPHDQPHATEWVNEMVALVSELLGCDAAYITTSGVYLRVRPVAGYGDLVHRGLDELRAAAGARVAVDDTKEDPLDFALWKAAKPGEPVWDAPWGPGRPGWHIECATMSLGILGEGFDLHGGGDDLVFPHHTNERAEALAAGRSFARHWMHNAMLHVGGEKMAKSLGNFSTVAELLQEHPLNSRALRLLVLQTHYRKTMEVSPAAMAQARSAIGRLDAMARKAGAAGAGVRAENKPGECDAAAVASFCKAMDHDLGTPEAVAVVFETLRRANAAIDNNDPDATELVRSVSDLTAALGIAIESDPTSGAGSGPADRDPRTTVSEAEISALISARSEARAARDFATADRIRAQLAELGVAVEDTPAGPVWHWG